MKEISIPFNLWSLSRMKMGKKIATSRYKKYGGKGDLFAAGGEWYVLRIVVKLPLWFIRDYLYGIEGAYSPQEFTHVWEDIHPSGLKENDEVYLHVFKQVVELKDNQKKLEFSLKEADNDSEKCKKLLNDIGC